MQHVVRTFPVNSYLHRIGKHSTGDCDWCAGKKETLTHFQTECEEFHGARHAAHNLIWSAVFAGIEKAAAPGWQFFRETSFEDLPFDFEWEDMDEYLKEGDRQPDGVAWHEKTKRLYLLECTRAMDHKHNLDDAMQRKGTQYVAAMAAFRRHQRTTCGRSTDRVQISTLPFIYGVRGSVMEKECAAHLSTVGVVNSVDRKKILTSGVRAAIQGLYNMKLARVAAQEVLHNEQAEAQALATTKKRKRQANKARKKSKPARTRKGTVGA